MQGMRISSQNAANVQAYIDYCNIVGGADNGKLFTPEQYEEYKENLRKNAGNRVYTSWRNIKGMDCKMIGPASTCLCGHKYKDHNYINPTNKQVQCKAKKCPCPCFYSVPVHGSSDFKCLCKVSYKLHDPITKKCPKGKFSTPSGRFSSTWSCSCGLQFGEHLTIFESREERIALGKPVDDMNRMMGEFGALTGGGLSNFSSMVDGAESFGAQIDALGSLEHQMKSIASSQSKPALPYKNSPEKFQAQENYNSEPIYNQQYQQPPGRQKLASLNQKLQLEREMDSLSIRDRNSISTMNSETPEEGISALELFRTPHSFGKPQTASRRQLKYSELPF